MSRHARQRHGLLWKSMYSPLETPPDRSPARNLPPIAHIAAPSFLVAPPFRSASPPPPPAVVFFDAECGIAWKQMSCDFCKCKKVQRSAQECERKGDSSGTRPNV